MDPPPEDDMTSERPEVRIEELSAGWEHSCARLSDGTVECWGSGVPGRLGFTPTETCTFGPCATSPTKVPGLSGVAQIAVRTGGFFDTCARLDDGTVKCWGDNPDGLLGFTSIETCDGNPCARTPTRVPGLNGVARIALGAGHTCALLTDATVECWGLNSLHQLGFTSTASCGGTECTNTPTPVPGLVDVVQIALGGGHTCALHGDGTVDCWGASDGGQTAAPPASSIACGKLSSRRCVPAPTKVDGLSNVVQLALGTGHSCALRADGTVKCWGSNLSRQLGTDTADACGGEPCAQTPTLVAGLTNVRAIAATREHTCALLADGTAKCWGDNPEGLLGFVSTEMCVLGPCAPTPTRVPGETNLEQISLGFVTCVLRTDRTFRCWGYNCDGELGNGTFGGCPMP